jgi:hypothetical protein
MPPCGWNLRPRSNPLGYKAPIETLFIYPANCLIRLHIRRNTAIPFRTTVHIYKYDYSKHITGILGVLLCRHIYRLTLYVQQPRQYSLMSNFESCNGSFNRILMRHETSRHSFANSIAACGFSLCGPNRTGRIDSELDIVHLVRIMIAPLSIFRDQHACCSELTPKQNPCNGMPVGLRPFTGMNEQGWLRSY